MSCFAMTRAQVSIEELFAVQAGISRTEAHGMIAMALEDGSATTFEGALAFVRLVLDLPQSEPTSVGEPAPVLVGRETTEGRKPEKPIRSQPT